MAENNFTLLMQLGPKQGETVAVLGDEFTMGRDPSNEWPIEDIEVSRRHARLVLENGSYSIEDLGSTNGTFVNGQRIRSLLPVLPGATIRLGENVLLFFDEGAAYSDDGITDKQPPEKKAASAEEPAKAARSEAKPEAPSPAEEEKSISEINESTQSDIQQVKARPRTRRKRVTSIPVFGNQIGLGVLAIALIAFMSLLASLWYVDSNFLWCDVFGNLISACR